MIERLTQHTTLLINLIPVIHSFAVELCTVYTNTLSHNFVTELCTIYIKHTQFCEQAFTSLIHNMQNVVIEPYTEYTLHTNFVVDLYIV